MTMVWNYVLLDKEELLLGEGNGYNTAVAALANAQNDWESAQESEDYPGQYDSIEIRLTCVEE